ncbi:MAG: Asp-tRNA(Asn)/Glu-tRNA(Gln) amidotransferase subunit GatB [Candidatus Omnitrophota bacterium]
MYEAVIGLEVHVHLNTKTKAFCGCSTEFGREPNSQTCPVCLGFPGSLPVLNKVALEDAIKVGLSLNCKVQEYTKFDRKNYFYPDLPKNYQISQYDLPISLGGFLDIESEDGIKRVGIRRVHLEEDAGKLIHQEDASLVDFNRAGISLLEIVSEPDISSPQEAHEYLTILKSIIEYLEVSDCDMEKGSLRCDANISIRKKGAKELGVKTELKNMNSFRAVKDALAFEIERQTELLNKGGAIVQETRLWDTKNLKTVSMRTKEEAMDYRYFPEPDLPPFIITKDKIEEIKKTIPVLPKEKKQELIRLGVSASSAGILSSRKIDAELAENLLKNNSNKKMVADWLINVASASANSLNCSISELGVKEEYYVEIFDYLIKESISNLSAKVVWNEVVKTKRAPSEIIKEKNLLQVSDEASLEKDIEEIIRENPKSVEAFKSGKENAIMFLVGQAMKKTKGKANPKVVQEILKRRLTDA